MFFKLIKSKKFVAITVLVTIFLGLFLVNVGEVKANVLKEAAKDILGGLFQILLSLAILFTGLVGKLFTGILNFGFKDMTMVYTGWIITRDIVNMFFILALIAIAFATILRIETYGMKTLLPKLIMIALFINFSYLLCGIIIDASQITANYFLDLIRVRTEEGKFIKADIGMTVLDRLNVTDALRGEEGRSVPISSRDPEMTNVINTAFSAGIIAVAGFVLLIGAVLLFIRIGALWALIIFAPFAWFFSIFPKLNTHASRWWSEFLKWSFFAPIYVFFIYLIIRISEETAALTQMGETPGPLQAMSLTAMTSNWQILFNYVFLIILLFGAPAIAMSMGIQGTGAAKSIVKGGLKVAYKLPGKLRGAAATMVPPSWMEKHVSPAAKLMKGIQKTAAFTSPELWKKAMEARKAERQRKARLPRIIGTQQDLLNLIYSLGSEKTNFAEQAEQFEIEERKKEIAAETKLVGSRLIAKRDEALKQKHIMDYKVCVELLQAQGDTNDGMIHSDVYNNIKYVNEYALDSLKGENVIDPTVNEDGTTNKAFSNLGFKHGTIQHMRQMGMSDKQIAPFLGKLQEISFESGYYGGYGMVETDKKGNVAIASDEKQLEVAAAKLRVIPARSRKLHGTAIGKQGVDEKGQYRFAGHEPVADALLRAHTMADIKETQLRYVRPDAQVSLEQAYKEGALKEISATADALGEKVYNAMTGKVKKAAEKGAEKGAEKAGKKTKEEVKKELEDLGLPK